MKNKKSCSAGVHERAGEEFGPLYKNLGRMLMCSLLILGLIFGLSGSMGLVSASQFVTNSQGDFNEGTYNKTLYNSTGGFAGLTDNRKMIMKRFFFIFIL